METEPRLAALTAQEIEDAALIEAGDPAYQLRGTLAAAFEARSKACRCSAGYRVRYEWVEDAYYVTHYRRHAAEETFCAGIVLDSRTVRIVGRAAREITAVNLAGLLAMQVCSAVRFADDPHP